MNFVYAPLLLLLAGRYLAPLVADMAAEPLMRPPRWPDDVEAYIFNDRALHVALAVGAFVCSFLTTLLVRRLERTSKSFLSDHIRQSALIYLLGATWVLGQVREALSDVWVLCHVCGPPLAPLVGGALLGNVSGLLAFRFAKVAA
jgi:hypothetical protein